MEITISGHTITAYNKVYVKLKFDSVADVFSFRLYFDPYDQRHKSIFKPFTYQTCTITHGGVLLMIGTILMHDFNSAGDPPRQYVDVSGYSLSGIIEDCTILNTDTTTSPDGAIISTPSQFTGLNIGQITKQICGMFPLKVIIDEDVADDCAGIYPNTEMKPDKSIKEYLDTLCKQKNIVLSHNNKGDIVLTRAKTNSLLTTNATFVKIKPVSKSSYIEGAPAFTATKLTTKNIDRPLLFEFDNGNKNTVWLEMSLRCDGQKLHSVTQVIGQNDGTNSSDVLTINPLVDDMGKAPFRNLRYNRIIQTAGDDNATLDTARSIAGDEIKQSLQLVIKIAGWELGGNLVTPNQMITVTNPDIYCYEKTKWFIQEVEFEGDESKETATLICTLPAAFNNDNIVNVFA